MLSATMPRAAWWLTRNTLPELFQGDSWLKPLTPWRNDHATACFDPARVAVSRRHCRAWPRFAAAPPGPRAADPIDGSRPREVVHLYRPVRSGISKITN